MNLAKVNVCRVAKYPAFAEMLAQSTLTLGSFWHGDILFGYFPICLDILFGYFLVCVDNLLDVPFL